ncbi:MAG: type II toxin-antitoxin system death-on-curing family toxin [Pseudomonadales bacterium]|nr:type II toxin-antitoxin system death-on-curing family toxin [Pseudomonadales bacterium]
MPSEGQSPRGCVAFLTLEEVLEIHTTLLQEFGGPPGVRDLGLLESALFRPRTGYYADLIEMAAALFESLLMHHPFVDGNKRVAFFAVDVFLRINGFHIVVETDDAHRKIIKTIEEDASVKESLEAFLRQHTVES